jgi:endonuclease YncB( thermonuclease family)
VYRIDHVVDGDTVVLRSGQHVRLVQIDTPEGLFRS